MKNKLKITGDLAITYGGVGLAAVLYFLFTLVASRLVGPYQWGVYSLSKSASAILIVIALIGIHSALVKFIPQLIAKKTPVEEQDKLISSAIQVVAITIPVIAVVWYFLAPLVANWLHDPSLTFYFRLTIFWMITGAVYSFVSDLLRAHKKFVYYNLMKVINMGALLGLAIALVFIFSKDAEWLIVAESMSYALVIGIGIGFVFSVRKFKLTKIHNPSVRKLLSFGLPIAPSALILILMSSVDRFFIGYFLDVTNVGYYAIAGILILSTAIIFDPLALVFFPNFASMIQDPSQKEKVRGYLTTLYNIVLYVGAFVVITFILVGPSIVRILYGNEYTPAVDPLKVLALIVLIYGFYIVLRSLIAVTYNTSVFLLMNGIAIIINIVGNWLLIPKMGLMGAAWATMLSYLAMSLIAIYLSSRKFLPALKKLEIGRLLLITAVLAPILYWINDHASNIWLLIIYMLLAMALWAFLMKVFRVSWFKEGLGNLFAKLGK